MKIKIFTILILLQNLNKIYKIQMKLFYNKVIKIKLIKDYLVL